MSSSGAAVSADPWEMDEPDSDDGVAQGAPAKLTEGVGRQGRNHSRSRSPPISRAPEANASQASGRRVLRQCPSCSSIKEPLSRPDFPPGTEWWAPVVWDAFLTERSKRVDYRPRQEFIHESFFSGSIMENFGARAMDLQWTTISASDKKKYARLFTMKNHKCVQHLFHDVSAQTYVEAANKRCDICEGRRKACDFEFRRPHLSVGGLPCQPFSRLRNTKGTGTDEQGASTHSKYTTIFELFRNYVANRQPHGLVLEEVVDFGRPERGAPKGGETPLERLAAMLADMGYYSQALMLDTAAWIEVSRPRLYIIAIDSECGGAEAVQWVVEQIQGAMRYRSVNKPSPIWSVLPVDNNHMVRRIALKQSQVRPLLLGGGGLPQAV